MHTSELEDAVVKARGMMLRGGSIRVVDRHGFLVEAHAVPAPGHEPWWYVAPGPLHWVLGGLFILQGLLGLVRRADGLWFWMYVAMTLVGVAYLVLPLVSRRRDRRLVREERAKSPG